MPSVAREPGEARRATIYWAFLVTAAIGAAYIVDDVAHARGRAMLALQIAFATMWLVAAVLVRLLPARAIDNVVVVASVLSIMLLGARATYQPVGAASLFTLVLGPVLASLVFPEQTRMVATVAVVSLAVVMGVTLSAHVSSNTVAFWGLQTAAMSALAVFSSHRYARLSAMLSEEAARSTTELTRALAASSGAMVRLRDESAVLAATADALQARGLDAWVFTYDAGALRPGPRAAREGAGCPSEPEQLAEAIRRGKAVFRAERAAAGGGRSGTAMPQVHAPVFVAGEPAACICVCGEGLSAGAAASIELFAGQVGVAMENARHHREARERLEELTRLQREVVARERLAALGEAAAVISHEVRNPLGAIVNAVALLKRDCGISTEGNDLLAMVEEEAMRLNRLVHDLLILARPMEPVLRTVDLGELVGGAVRVMKSAAEREVILRVRIEPVRSVAGDPDFLHLAVCNLLRNALQASSAGEVITVQVSDTLEGACVSVEDRGPGIAEADLLRIFDPFFTTRATGTGLGLAIVRRVAQMHGGKIRVANLPDGRGARFTLTLRRTS